MRHLILRQTLEFYDVPQIFVAQDTMRVNYLCLLYAQNDACEYIAVQVSELRLDQFTQGKTDLRQMFLDPEQDNSTFHVTVSNERIIADRLLQPADITEDMLPEPGYYFDAEDAAQTDDNIDTLQLSIPTSDRGFLADIVCRMGWHTRRIAVL